MITAIGIFSGVSWSTIIYNVALSWVFVGTYLCSALTATHYKWGYFAFGTYAYLLLSLSLLRTGMTTSKRLNIKSHYLPITSWLIFMWLLYPIAYGVADGGNKIGVTEGFIFFGVLDCLTVPLLSSGILMMAMKWDYRAMNIYFTQYGRVPPPAGGEFMEREKAAPVAGGESSGVMPENSV